MRRWRKFLLPLIAGLMLIFAIKMAFNKPERITEVPVTPAPIAQYKNQIAGVGIIEPQSENISIGTNLSGIITKVYVEVGAHVKKGDKLFTIDDRDVRAQLDQARAQVAVSKVEYEDASHRLAIFQNVADKRAVSSDILSQRKYAAELARSKIALSEAQARVKATELERLTVTAPIDGTILKVNARPGEFAESNTFGMAPDNPLIIMGNIDVMHVRVDIDETDAKRLKPGMTAAGSLRGDSKSGQVPLSFIRFEPYVIPKRSLTGDSNERVDSRVLQLIYSFDNKDLSALVGQQMDVFISAEE